MRKRLAVHKEQRILYLGKELIEMGYDRELEAEVNDHVIVLFRPGSDLTEQAFSLDDVANRVRGRVLDERLGRAIGKEVKNG